MKKRYETLLERAFRQTTPPLKINRPSIVTNNLFAKDLNNRIIEKGRDYYNKAVTFLPPSSDDKRLLENWNSNSKNVLWGNKEVTIIPISKIFNKIITKNFKWDNRAITIVALIKTIEFTDLTKTRQAYIGIAIKNPNDKQDKKISEVIAKGRAIKKPILKLYSDGTTFLTYEDIENKMKDVVTHIKINPRQYIAGYKDDVKGLPDNG